ncbi:hypothetical protein ASE12_12020 [Aeromicrobium sp. Root236]|uniref:bifunctional lysylphosphatidylglycerol synthetase/lysine--tRNA ligase LysX n=1 Tax=Aeromicrobium sp. Root236 TaxID=1736498 RepID=UPI0006FD3E19|nr:bifunctional lysylphosphatidylglycerol synthetase/lysine--tRNA ligase LysX [Aeromicrobium sp. Root236]KRC65413.1 hypothetical protein ASE12_12020 [Aeromicrobium sp. Root236]
MPRLTIAPSRTAWVPRGAGVFLAVWAIACAVLTLFVPLRHLTRPVWTALDDYVLFLSPNLAWAAFLGLLAAAVAARKRPAWWVLVGLLIVNLSSSRLLVDGVSPRSLASTVVAAGGLVIVAVARGQFTTAVRRASFGKALVVLVLGITVSTLAGTALVMLVHGDLPAAQRLSWTLNKVGGGLVENGVFDGRPPEWVGDLLGLLGALSLLGAVATIFQSQTLRAELGPPEERALRALLGIHGGQDSLGYFATRRDKAVVFAPNGRAAVLYRVEIGVCLASGDPIGDRASWPAAIAAWQRIADDHGWAQAVMGSSEAGAHAYERAGLTAIQLGDEAIIETHGFSLRGPDMHVVRQAVRRVERQGYTARIRRHGSVGAADMARVIDRAEKWRGDETERGFSMALGRLGDPADAACVLVEALDGAGELRALLSFVPWGPNGMSLDLMRRDPTAPNGVIEFMVSELTRQGPALSVMRVSLNFAVFRAAFEEGNRIGAGPVLRAWRRLLILLSRWWQLEALYRSNVKFSPTWNPRFLCYADARMLARIGVASGMAEGFVTIPAWMRSTKGIAPPGLSTEQLEQITADLLAETARAHADPLPPARCRTRHAKLETLETYGMAPYPAAGSPRPVAGAVEAPGQVIVSGRIVQLRDHGGVVFVDLRDWTGDVQVVLARDEMPAESLAAFRRSCDTGDLVDVTCRPRTTDTGHRSLFASSWRMSAKSLHPPGADDRAGDADACSVLRTRSAVIRSLRSAMEGRGFTEVETPILQPVHGGANARPFATHLHAYDLDLTLRIAPELYLKRLSVAGMERVFEIGRVFRNEGIDRRHHPEFTSLEAYQAHADYADMRTLCRSLILDAATAAHGDAVAQHPVLGRCDLTADWPVVTVHEAVSAALQETVDLDTPVALLTKLCQVHDVAVPDTDDPGRLVVELYEARVEPATMMPTFYTDFPSTVCPLTRSKDAEPAIAERWDLVAFGMEIATAYSELTDPVEQRRRLRAQSLLAAGGDVEAMQLDEDFLASLERGMPPTGGLGLGVDRLLMMLTGRPIRDVVAFPLTRGRTGKHP